MSDEEPYYVIGCIDAYGAIHHEPLCFGEESLKTHDMLWPQHTHKRWRFNLAEWKLERSVLSSESITPAEAEDIIARMRKHFKPPLWLIQGEEWDALGRPREGKAYERHCKRWERIYARKKSH